MSVSYSLYDLLGIYSAQRKCTYLLLVYPEYQKMNALLRSPGRALNKSRGGVIMVERQNVETLLTRPTCAFTVSKDTGYQRSLLFVLGKVMVNTDQNEWQYTERKALSRQRESMGLVNSPKEWRCQMRAFLLLLGLMINPLAENKY